MFTRGQGDFGRGADEGRKRPVAAHAGAHVFLRQLEQTEEIFVVAFRHECGGRPGIIRGQPLLANVDPHFSRGDSGGDSAKGGAGEKGKDEEETAGHGFGGGERR